MQGYLTLALDHPRYLEMALNLGRSLKYFDPARPRCLVHNGVYALGPNVAAVFTDVVEMKAQAGYVGCMNKLLVYDISPYDSTMYVDADCLLVKNDIDRHWNKLHGTYFAMTGEKRNHGTWNKLDFEKVCAILGVPYIVQMNSGVFAFRREARARTFFDTMKALYREHRDLLSNVHQSRREQYADEPFFGTAMGVLGVDPTAGTAREGSWMVTTWRARNCYFDLEHNLSRIDKPCSYWFGISRLPRAFVRHSPTIAHFIGLKPARQYHDAAIFFTENSKVRG